MTRGVSISSGAASVSDRSSDQLLIEEALNNAEPGPGQTRQKVNLCKGGRKFVIKWTKHEKVLVVLFLLTIPLVRPWVHGDGYSFYAFARSVLFQGNLDFEPDFERASEKDTRKVYPDFRSNFLTPNGHIWNHATIGPAILWSPFLITARVVTPAVDRIRGTQLANDGFSKPYIVAMALGTLFYGFLTLWISFRLARKYTNERWALIATVGIWLATSFAFYLYVEPSFSHTHSAFLIALFLWFWDCTRGNRTVLQWLGLGLLAGLMMDTYYPNTLVLLLPLIESLHGYWAALRGRSKERFGKLAVNNLLFAAVALAVFFPTMLTKKILWGSYFRTGYKQEWYWNSPAFFRVCFSSHGVFSWTPILIPAVVGLYLLRRADRALSYFSLATLFAYFYFIGCYQDWHAAPSFGNRFFVGLTPFFILGLAVLLKELSRLWNDQRVAVSAWVATGVLFLWNCGLVYQFAAHLVPQDRDTPVSWSQVAYNQVAVVPGQVAQLVKSTLAKRFSSESMTN